MTYRTKTLTTEVPVKQNVAHREIKHNLAIWPSYALRHKLIRVEIFVSGGGGGD